MSIPKRLTSRKFWLAVGSFITFVANNQWTEAMGIIIAYLAVEGAYDTFNSSDKSPVIETSMSHNEDDIDTGVVITGNTPLFNEKLKDEE